MLAIIAFTHKLLPSLLYNIVHKDYREHRRENVGSNNNYMKYNKCLHTLWSERENLWHFT